MRCGGCGRRSRVRDKRSGVGSVSRSRARCGRVRQKAIEAKTVGAVKAAACAEVMDHLDRVTRDPLVMSGQACIRGMRVTVGMIASGRTTEEMLELYP